MHAFEVMFRVGYSTSRGREPSRFYAANPYSFLKGYGSKGGRNTLLYELKGKLLAA